MGGVRDRVESVARGVTYRVVEFGQSNPVTFAAGLFLLAVALVVLGLLYLTGVWRYLVWLVAAYFAYRLLSSGALMQAVQHMRSEPRRYVWLGVLLIGAGLAFPYVVEPQPYANVQVQLAYKLTSGSGWLGFVVAVLDVNSIQVDVSVVDAYGGVPGLHPAKGVPEFRNSPGSGWWVCLSEVAQGVPRERYCWEIPGVNVFVRAVSGDWQRQGYYVEGVPLHSDRGFFEVTVYSDRVAVWSKKFPYVVENAMTS